MKNVSRTAAGRLGQAARQTLRRLARFFPGLFASPLGRSVRTLHLSACMVYLFFLLLLLTQLFGFYVYLPVLGELYSTDFTFLCLIVLAGASLVYSVSITKRVRLSFRFAPQILCFLALMLLEIPVTWLIVRQPIHLIAKEAVYYFVPPLCFFALLQYPEIRQRDFLPRLLRLIVLFSIVSSAVALIAFSLYSLAEINLLQVTVTSALIRNGSIRLKVGGIVLYTGLIISMVRVLERNAGRADAVNLILGLIHVVFVSKTRTVVLYLAAVFFLVMMTEKKTHWLVKLLFLFLSAALLIFAFILSDSLTPALYSYLYGDAGFVVRLRAISHYWEQFLAHPLTGIGLISSSKSIAGWQLLYGPAGQYYRSDVGLIGLINEFGLLGLIWSLWFLFGSFRAAGRSGSPMARTVKSLLLYLTVGLINLSFLDPGRCMYLFLIYTFLETMPGQKTGPGRFP